jgi:hypothetical protein
MAELARNACATLASGCEPASDRLTIFIVEVTGAKDALARILCPFAVLQADLAHVELRRTADGATIRQEVEGLDDQRAQVLARRLGQSPTVLGVSLGWRAL